MRGMVKGLSGLWRKRQVPLWVRLRRPSARRASPGTGTWPDRADPHLFVGGASLEDVQRLWRGRELALRPPC